MDNIKEYLFPKKAIHAPEYGLFIEKLKEMAVQGKGRWFNAEVDQNFISVGCTVEEAKFLTERFIL